VGEIAVREPQELMFLAQAEAFLAKAESIDEVKNIRDKAEAVRLYAKKRRLGIDIQNQAAEIAALADRRAGELLAKMERQKQGRPDGKRSHGATIVSPKLADLGVSKSQSSRSQLIARLPEKQFKEYVADRKAKGQEITSRDLQRLAKRHVDHERRTAEFEARAEAAAEVTDARWEIIEGDCIEVMPTLAAGSFRLIFADPPYNNGTDYGDGARADLLPPDKYLARCRQWMEAAARLLTPDGSLWVLIDPRWAGRFQCLLEDIGLYWRETIAWVETFGVYSEHRFGNDHRYLFHFTRDPKRQVFHPDREESKRQVLGDKRANPDGRVPSNVWTISRLRGTHGERIPGVPTQLRVEPLIWIVETATDPGDWVLDPFSGTGTTGAAALRTGRHYRGIERSHKYVEASCDRLRAVAAAAERAAAQAQR
jgi:DNA modification methylase